MREFHELVSRHRKWLDGLGLLKRPWVLLGGAPDPSLPARLLETHARVDINNSGLAAARMGLGRADLTIRRTKESWQAHPGLDTRGLLWFTRKATIRLRLELLLRRKARVDSLMRADKVFREALVAAVAGTEIKTVGDLGKPSNGIAALCYGLHLGVPEIVVAGMSLSRSGHSYDQRGRPRKQIAEDSHVLKKLCDDPRVATTELDLAAMTGIRLWESIR